jgi:hypothetical protein
MSKFEIAYKKRSKLLWVKISAHNWCNAKKKLDERFNPIGYFYYIG